MTVTYKGLDCVADMGSDEYEKYYKISQSGKHTWAYQGTYAFWCLYFGAVLVFLAIMRKAAYMYSDWSYRNYKLGKKCFRFRILEKITALGRMVSYRRIPLIISRVTGLPSTLGTLLVLGASTLFVLCVAFIPHFWYRGCRGFGSPPLAVRTGMMCMALTPFLIIVSGKTNFISFVTGISYEKINIFHQGLGWGSLFLGLVHTFPFIIQSSREGGIARVKYMWDNEFIYKNGVPPLIFLFLLCVLSTRVSGWMIYEVWWHSHWVLGLAYFATLCWHVYGSMNSERYIWGTLGFWVFQMLYRALVKTTFKPNNYSFKSKEASLKSLPEGVFEVSVPIESKYELEWAPGQHVFIRFVYGLHTLDNHPFSVLTTSKSMGNSTLKLVVKPCKGLTKKLYDLIKEEKAEKKLRCYLDGPYGGINRDPMSFDKLVLVATGTGVSVTAPFLSYVAEHALWATNCVEKVEFYWVIHTEGALEWIYEELVSALQAASEAGMTSMFDINIFVTNTGEGSPTHVITAKSQISTSESTTPDSGSKDQLESKEFGETMKLDEYIKIFHNSKPDFFQLLQTAQLGQKTAFICSGTGSVQEAVGNAVSVAQKKVLADPAVQEVYLHTENFGW